MHLGTISSKTNNNHNNNYETNHDNNIANRDLSLGNMSSPSTRFLLRSMTQSSGRLMDLPYDRHITMDHFL